LQFTVEYKNLKQLRSYLMKSVLRSALLVGALFVMPACDQMADKELQRINDKVAADAVEQYNIAKNSGGSSIDMCVQAGVVAAAYLQAKNDIEYSRWKSRQGADCSTAKVPY